MAVTAASAVTLPSTFGDFLRGVDDVWDEAALHALPTVLDLDVSAPHQVKDLPRQVHEGLEEEEEEKKRSSSREKHEDLKLIIKDENKDQVFLCCHYDT